MIAMEGAMRKSPGIPDAIYETLSALPGAERLTLPIAVKSVSDDCHSPRHFSGKTSGSGFS
jgi:hypothetical protein